MRVLGLMVGCVMVSGCLGSVPNSAAHVRGENFEREAAAREAQLSGEQPLSALNTAPPPATMPQVATTNGAGTNPSLPVASSAAPADVSTAPISDENDFDAVGARRSIQDDEVRIARNQAQYQVVQPTSLPQRQSSGPNVVDYALKTTNPLGTTRYTRNSPRTGEATRRCAKYVSSDKAQLDFLIQGGPERDKLGLDPDGDGYACKWDPRPFRKALGG